MEQTSMSRLIAARLAAGVDSESIVRELSQNFEYVKSALRAYVDGYVEAGDRSDETADETEENQPLPRSFRLAR
jgi:hypothetical protein